MEWKKVQKTDHTFPKGIVLKNLQKKSEYINSMTHDSTSSSLYTVPSNPYQQRHFSEKCFLVLCECLSHGWSCTAELRPRSSVQVLCAPLPAHFPA